MNARTFTLGAVALGITVVATLRAQGTALDRRVSAVADGAVELHFAARADACGDGAHWYRVGDDSWYGSFTGSDDAATRAACTEGPVRVRVALASREIVRITSYVGPLQHGEGATDLGEIPAAEASAWLLTLASRLDGRPARDAILPAVLARGGSPVAELQRVARDEDRSHDTRRAALSALPRVADNVGVSPLIAFTAQAADPWLAREALRVIARSGDPRARAQLRVAVQDTKSDEDLRSIAISALGNEYATAADGALLRDAYRTFDTERARSSVLNAVASVGGRANTEWLLAIARSSDQSPALRSRAVQALERIDSPEAINGLITLASPRP